MASAALTMTDDHLVGVAESDASEAAVTYSGSSNRLSVTNAGSNPATIKFGATIATDPDAVSGSLPGEFVLHAGGHLPLPTGCKSFYHKSTSGTIINVYVER